MTGVQTCALPIFQDQVQPPFMKSHQLDLAFLPFVDDIRPRRSTRITMNPLSPEHSDESHQQGDGQTGEEDGLSRDGGGAGIQDGDQRIESTKRGVLL